MNFGWCGGGLALDWMYLHEFKINNPKNWSGGSSLVVRDHLALLVDGSGAVIASEMAVFDRDKFGRCGGRFVLDWMYLTCSRVISTIIGVVALAW